MSFSSTNVSFGIISIANFFNSFKFKYFINYAYRDDQTQKKTGLLQIKTKSKLKPKKLYYKLYFEYLN